MNVSSEVMSLDPATEKLTIRLQGGLGNQLFQLAFAIWISQTDKRQISLDASRLGPKLLRRRRRPFELTAMYLPFELTARTGRLSVRQLTARRPDFVDEYTSLAALQGRTSKSNFVEGYFQDYRIVDAVHERMLELISLHLPHRPRIQGTVGVHVRLGDYIRNRKARAFHGPTDPRWSISEGLRIAHDIDAKRLLIFTDSPNLIPRQKPLPNMVTEFATATRAWDVVRELSACDAIVLSNSSLSWWAGFLHDQTNRQASKLLVPTPWLREPSSVEARLLPPTWERRLRSQLS